MSKRIPLFFYLFPLSVLIFYGCKSSKKITADTHVERTDYKSARVLTQYLKANEFHFDWLSAKFDCDATIDSSKNGFNVAMRMRKDSIIWMSVSPALGIEVARAVITKDSVKFINRLNSTYFSGDFNFISKLLHTDLDYEILQSLLIGNSVEFYEEDEKLRSSTDKEKNQYLLSTVRKRQLKKVMEKNKEMKEPVQTIWLEDGTFKIVRILFQDFNTNREFDAAFGKFEKEDSLLFPHKINYLIKAEKNISIDISYSKISVNKLQTFPFSIPEKYESVIKK